MATQTYYKGTDQVSMSEEDAKTFQGGTDADPYGGLVRSGWSTTAPKSNIIPTTENVVGGSSGVRQGVTEVKNQATELVNQGNSSLAGLGLDTETSKVYDAAAKEQQRIQADYQDLIDTRKSLGLMSQEELDQINQAGESAAGEFAPLISEAEQAKRQGMPTATIGAGERGGFMNTQFAGAAALAPIEGGDFVGAGGELERIKSVYDNNISNLKAQQVIARNQAMDAARKAIRTGKKEDLDLSIKLLDSARQMNQDAIDLANSKLDAIAKVTDMQNTRAVTIAKSLAASVLTGDKTKDNKIIQDAAKQYGVDPNILLGTVSEYNAEKDATDLALLKTKVDIAKDIPKGQTYTDPDSGIMILGTQDAETMEIVKTIGGNEFKIIYDMSDKSNPKELTRFDLGPRWKGGGGSEDGETSVQEALMSTAEYLNGLKKTGQFNDLTYNVAINSLAKQMEYEDIESIKTQINTMLGGLEGKSITQSTPAGTQINAPKVANKEIFPGLSIPVPTKEGISSFDPTRGKTVGGESFGQSSTPQYII